MKNLLALCVTAVTLLFVAQPAQAHSPPELAKRCVHAVNSVVERCTQAAAEETHRCVAKIRRLLEEGNERAAHEVARECIQMATERTRKCVARVKRICDACVEQLLAWGEPELARRVDRVCDEAVERLRSILQREKNAIRKALEG